MTFYTYEGTGCTVKDVGSDRFKKCTLERGGGDGWGKGGGKEGDFGSEALIYIVISIYKIFISIKSLISIFQTGWLTIRTGLSYLGCSLLHLNLHLGVKLR